MKEMKTEKICSLQNSKVKRLVALQQKSSERRREGVFVVEGRRELEHCVEAGFRVESVFVCPEMGCDPATTYGGAKDWEALSE